MDFVLRQGETFTRWWTPQGGRWNHHPSYGAKPFPRELIERAPRGPKCKHPSFTLHTHGNGRFVYRPDLTSAATDFADGVYDSANVTPGPRGLMLEQAGQGHAIFEVRTPYVIVPQVNNLDDPDDDREASVVRLEAAGARLFLSLDNGVTWREVGAAATAGQPLELDLTPHVRGRYGYLLKIALDGAREEALVRQFEISTWVQAHPASLPALRQGKNLVRLANGDHYGFATRVAAVCVSAGQPEEFLEHLVERPKDYDPNRKTGRVRGSFVARLPASPGTKIAWFSAGASFATHQGSAARNTRNTIAYAVEQSGDFREIYRAQVPPDQAHWNYNVDREVKLDQPAPAVFVQFTGDPALNAIRLYGHCVEDRFRPESTLRIRHAWTENGLPKTKEIELTRPASYEIDCAAEPVNGSIELSVPSGKAKGG